MDSRLGNFISAKKISILLIFCYFILAVFTFAQAQNAKRIDSLKNVINREIRDSARAREMISLAWELKFVNPDSAKMLVTDAMKIYKTGRNMGPFVQQFGFSKCNQYFGVLNYIQGNYDSATVYYFKALEHGQKLTAIIPHDKGEEKLRLLVKERLSLIYGNLAVLYGSKGESSDALLYFSKALKADEERKDSNGVARNLGNIGLIHSQQGNYVLAMDYYFKSLRINKARKNELGEAANLISISTIFKEQGETEKALNYLFTALKLKERLDDLPGVALILSNIGNIYRDGGKNNDALDVYFKSLKIYEKFENKKGMATVLGNIGNVYSGTHEYAKSFEYYNKSLVLEKNMGNKSGVGITLGNIGASLFDQKKNSEAKNYIVESLKISKEVGDILMTRDNYRNLAKIDSTNKDYKGAFGNYIQYITYRDSVASKENIKRLTRLEIQYEFDKKILESKVEQDKKDAISAEEKRKQGLILSAVVAGLVLVLVFALFMFRAYKVKQKANIVISRQKHLIEEKQKEILDSIHYARRIQSSLLPREIYVEKQLEKLNKS